MLDLLILVFLIGGLITGFRRGLVLQAIQMFGFIVAFIVSYLYYKSLAEKFVLWVPYPGVTAHSKLAFSVGELDLEMTFYRMLAFVLIFIVVKFGLQLIASMFDFLKYLPVLGFGSQLVGAFLGVIEFYISMFLILYIAYLLPIDFIQSFIQKSIFAKSMFEHTPILSETVKNWWFIYKG